MVCILISVQVLRPPKAGWNQLKHRNFIEKRKKHSFWLLRVCSQLLVSGNKISQSLTPKHHQPAFGSRLSNAKNKGFSFLIFDEIPAFCSVFDWFWTGFRGAAPKCQSKYTTNAAATSYSVSLLVISKVS